MNALTPTDQPPVPPLGQRAMYQAGIPGERHGNRAPVREVDHQGYLDHSMTTPEVNGFMQG